MATKCVVNKSTLSGIADAIRAKGGTTETMLPSQMAAKIEAIPSGGGSNLDWGKPDDWPAFDLLDPRIGPKEAALFLLCDSQIGTEPFISVTSCTKIERLNLSQDGTWSVAETIATVGKKACIWLDKTQRFTVFRCVGCVGLSGSVVDAEHAESYPTVRNAICGEIVYGAGITSFGVFGTFSAVSTVFRLSLLYVRIVDLTVTMFGDNGWRASNSVKCVVYDNFMATEQTFGRCFELVETMQKVYSNNTKHKIRAGNNVFIGHYGGAKFTDYDWSSVDPSLATDLAYMCQNWSLIKSIDLTKFAHWGKTEDGSPNIVGSGGKITSINSSFYGCYNLVDLNISCLDLSGVTSTAQCFTYCGAMQDLTMPPPERNLRVSFSINTFTLMSRENIVKILNSLADISGGAAQTLTMGAVMLGKLTDDDKRIATNKGWTLA